MRTRYTWSWHGGTKLYHILRPRGLEGSNSNLECGYPNENIHGWGVGPRPPKDLKLCRRCAYRNRLIELC